MINIMRAKSYNNSKTIQIVLIISDDNNCSDNDSKIISGMEIFFYICLLIFNCNYKHITCFSCCIL